MAAAAAAAVLGGVTPAHCHCSLRRPRCCSQACPNRSPTMEEENKVGAGEGGEQMVTVGQALRPSLLDGPPGTLVEGERIPVDGVKVSSG